MKCQSLTRTASRSHMVKSVQVHMTHRGGVNRRTDRWIFKTFLPGFQSQSEILMDFQILQLQRNADSSIFWVWFLDFACNTNIFAQILDSGRKFNCRFG